MKKVLSNARMFPLVSLNVVFVLSRYYYLGEESLTEADLASLGENLEPLSESVLQVFPDFDPCQGAQGQTLAYSPSDGTFETPAVTAPVDAICWHAKIEGKQIF